MASLHARYEEWLIENPTQHGDDVPVLVLDANQDAATCESLHEDFCAAIHKALEEKSAEVKLGKTSPPAHADDQLKPTGSPLTPTHKDSFLRLPRDFRRALFSPPAQAEAEPVIPAP